MPHTRRLTPDIFEVRAKAAEGIGRTLYCTQVQKKIYILSAFVKKSQKTPRNELFIARERMKEVPEWELLMKFWLRIWKSGVPPGILSFRERIAGFDKILKARFEAGLTQEAVAQRMGTSQAAVARLEGNLAKGRYPSVRSMQRYAKAVGKHLEIRLV